jgi:ankyrin repeat protein
MLIGRGADATLVNKNGKSVLTIALERGFWAIAEQLRKAGAKETAVVTNAVPGTNRSPVGGR